MSGLYRDEGVVLRTYKLGEADRIVVLATAAHGKVRAVAKGVRKTKSKFGSRLEPLSHVDVQLYEGRNLDTITQVESIDTFRAIRDDLDRYGSAVGVLEVIDQIAMEGEVDQRRYAMLVGVLRTISTNDNPLVVPAFYLKVLAHEGFQPEVDACVSCGNGDPLVSIDLLAGGMLCQDCRQGRKVSPEALRLLRAVLGGGLASVLAEEPSPAVAEVGAIATEAVEHHLERRLRTPGMLDQHRL
ncbi:DNA repair protein RecO [Actinospongicola halichondriae]|uniref:DNA repair protein RecO n=1 Tax=Actinospongicola halichondriae TaxID=3236844 RepID=UPI003D503CFC